MSEVDLEADAGAMEPEQKESILGEIGDLANTQVKLEKEVAEAEEALKAKKAELNRIQLNLLPDAMARAGIQKFTTTDGHSIEVKDTVAVNIKAADKAKAFAWMIENGYDSLVKTVITLPFGAGDAAEAKRILSYLESEGFEPTSKTDVHAQTLKAWGKECLESGVSTPDIIKIDTFPKAVIK